MSAIDRYPHITISSDGTARIGQTRYKVLHLAAEHYQHGWTAEELLRQHPDLRPEEVYSALAYFYDHHEAFILQMNESATMADASRTTTSVSREELMARRKSMKQD